jgi:hypothetical protein
MKIKPKNPSTSTTLVSVKSSDGCFEQSNEKRADPRSLAFFIQHRIGIFLKFRRI